MASPRSVRPKSFPTHSGPSRVLSCRAALIAEDMSHTGGTANVLRHRERPAVLCCARRREEFVGVLSINNLTAVAQVAISITVADQTLDECAAAFNTSTQTVGNVANIAAFAAMQEIRA